MDSPASLRRWGFILISVPNLNVIGGTIVLFAIALIALFAHAEGVENVSRT